MKALNLLAIMLLTPAQLALVIFLAFVFVALVAGNIWLYFYLRNRGVRKLCTHQLQNKRDELLQQLDLLREGILLATEEEADEDEEEAEEMLIVDEEDDDYDEEDDDDDDDVLLDGDLVTATVAPISASMYDYLEGLLNNSNSSLMFAGDFCLGYFLASPVAERSVTYRPDEF